MKNVIELINKILIIFYSFFLLLNFVDSIDSIGPQWLYFSFFNLLVFIYTIYTKQFFFSIKLFKSKPLFFYSLFILCCFLSIFWSKFVNYTVQDSFRVLSTYISIILIYILFKKMKNTFVFISFYFLLLLILEVFYALFPFLKFLFNHSFFVEIASIDTELIEGFGSNPNITAASIVVKFPFLLYFIYKSKLPSKVFLSFFSIFFFLLLLLLGSRASFLSILIQLSIFSFSLFYLKKFKSFIITLFLLSSSFLFSNFYTNQFIVQDNAVSQLSSIQITNQSSSNRFLLWEHTLKYLYQHPFGCGFGNWKIESIPFWKDMGSVYQVPYHAHNDFLEIFAELGYIGGSIYILIFIALLLSFLKPIVRYKSLSHIIFLLMLISYIIDAMLNFPLERPLMQFSFIFIFVFHLLHSSNHKHI